MKIFIRSVLFLLIFSSLRASAQQDSVKISATQPVVDSAKQRDIYDIVGKVLHIKTSSAAKKSARKLNFAVVPALGYSLSTGFAAAIVSNVAFYTSSSHQENLSAIGAEVFYDTKTQKVFVSRSEIWADQNNYKLVTDLRWERYPEDTYGIGTRTTPATMNHLDFLYVRTYVTLYKKLIPNLYAGLGYNLDYHYHITQDGNVNGTTPDYTRYGYTSKSTSSGVNADLLYDSRRNPINPLNGAYALLTYRENTGFLGSDNNWRGIQLDVRKYLRPSDASNNVLAFWGMAAFTSGNVPYLDLPATGEDMYNNAGRGYTRDRFRGKNMLYLESEYRFGLTPNGLLGAVVFANAQSFSELQSNRFEKVAPAAGTGIRIKINKHSDTNICIDYAVGTSGSHGFFVSLGEVF